MIHAVFFKDSDSEVAWHFDRDYPLESSGLNVHPMLATVTYLSEHQLSILGLNSGER